MNSDSHAAHGWGRAWLGGVVLFVGLASLVALGAGQLGYRPRLTDDKDSWALQRERISDDPKELVLIGQSRILLGFSVETARRELPGWRVVQLAIMGHDAGPTLKDLADRTGFRGVLIHEIPEMGLDPEHWGQQRLVDHFHDTWSLDRKLNREMRSAVQSRTVLLNPRLNPLWQLYSLTSTGELIKPDYLSNSADRDHAAHWDEPSAHRIIEERWAGYSQKYRDGSLFEMYNFFTKELEQGFPRCEPYVDKIIARGGKVVYLRMPTYPPAGIGHLLEERYFRPLFARERAATRATIIHALDVPEMTALRMPDGEHLDARDRPRFTEMFIGELRRRGILPR